MKIYAFLSDGRAVAEGVAYREIYAGYKRRGGGNKLRCGNK